MARLRAPVSAAAWPLITLAVIVCLGQSVGAARDFKEILKHGFKASTEQRTDDEWKKLGTAALEEIQRKDVKGLVHDDAKHWLAKLTGISRETDCSDDMVADLIGWRSTSKEFKKFDKILKKYLKLYLDECGLEERFKAAVDKLKQSSSENWSSSRYKTLRKYLKGRYLSVGEAKQLLSVVSDILELGGNTGETDCSDEHMDTIVRRQLSEGYDAAREFLDGYVNLYLDKCGFETRFKRAIDALKQVDPEQWSRDTYKTLHRYLSSKYWAAGEAMDLLSIIDDIVELDSNPHEANCTDEYMDSEVYMKIIMRPDKTFGFKKGFAWLYLEKCGFEGRFKNAISILEKVSPEYWGSFPYRTMQAYLETEKSNYATAMKVLQIVKDVLEISSAPGKTDCKAEHMITVVGNRVSVQSDDEFLQARNDYAKLYLEKCGYERLFKQAIDKLKQISPEHWSHDCYQTLWGYLESREWNFSGEMDLMSVVNAIAKIDSINEETDCTDERMINVVMMDSHTIYYKFMDDYGELYSRKCGFEDRFQRAIENVEKVSTEHWQSASYPSLIGYLRLSNIISAQDGLLRLLPAIREISKPESITGDIDCSEKRVAQVSDWFARRSFNYALYHFLSGYYKFYQEKCRP